ncbi:MAG: hypothetical protein RMJ15_07700 [Nitrososphaerota archaeon]|nr:hypothetical protein [Candidatus Bathyarchaeota archaeon]MDW8023601.1 hypothetical protein [Nitrososphaerota archaeon]
MITTSRRPTRAIRTFCRDLSHTIPGTLRINRGKLSLEGLVEKALEFNADKLVIVDRWRGGPGKIQFFVRGIGLQPVPPLIYLRRVKLRRDFPKVMPKGKRIRSVAIADAQSASAEAEKLKSAFSKFFSIPIISYGAIEGYDAVMQIIREHDFLTVTFKLVPEMVEIGPHMRISHLIWEV